MGQERFDRLLTQLPEESVVLGIDEQVACVVDFERNRCQVFGPGGVTVISRRGTIEHGNGETFSIDLLRSG
jgi:cyanophycinase-like exopeptidase